jgi:hypothetical protein
MLTDYMLGLLKYVVQTAIMSENIVLTLFVGFIEVCGPNCGNV